jgi:hypothetical protein
MGLIINTSLRVLYRKKWHKNVINKQELWIVSSKFQVRGYYVPVLGYKEAAESLNSHCCQVPERIDCKFVEKIRPNVKKFCIFSKLLFNG